MKSNLKIYTSFVSPETIKLFPSYNILPVFIIRNISNSKLIGMYSGTIIHMKELSPATELYQRLKSGIISFGRYQKEYVIGLAGLNFSNIIKKLERLEESSQASGIVLMGYEQDPELCHRSLLGDVLNRTGLLVNEVREANIST